MTKEIELGGHKYVIGYAPADEALVAGARVLNMLGPALEGLRFGFGGAMANLLTNPALGQHLTALTAAFAPYTQVVFPSEHGRRPKSATLKDVYATHFRGRLGDQVKWLAAAVEFNLADFLVEVKARLDDAKAAAEASSPSSPPKPADQTG